MKRLKDSDNNRQQNYIYYKDYEGQGGNVDLYTFFEIV